MRIDSYIWILSPRLVELFGKDEGGVALLEEICHGVDFEFLKTQAIASWCFLPGLVDGAASSIACCHGPLRGGHGH